MVVGTLKIDLRKNYTPNRKKKVMNEWMNEKPQKCMCMSNTLAFLSKPERTY